MNLTYRFLGSLAEAEDAVQETYARWYALSRQEQEAIASPGAWLTRVAARICLDVLGSARARRERYVGEWVPEPVPDTREWGSGIDPAEQVTLDESVDMALLVVLETMTPAERIAFVLHDVFRYPYAEVATVLGRTPEACRQLASSARRRARTARAAQAPTAQQTAVVHDFRRAWDTKDIAALIALLAPDATLIADGGGLVGAALRPITGAGDIVRYLTGIGDRAPAMNLLQRTVNGRAGLVAQTRTNSVTVTVAAFNVGSDGRVTHIWAVRNPEKLQRWSNDAVDRGSLIQ
ncbi:RNA polymerase sigma factor SigJ [Streptomyces sp. cg35]|uniref:RNA polymerase sigma factor SigJ n=1 Tax=Streptomyces sp. cg35 TaxID=3421650 RepID=UPI003D166C57